MSTHHNLVKLKFQKSDFKRVLEGLFDMETGLFDIDKLIPVPKSLQMPICTDMILTDRGMNTIRLSEFAVLEYLFSLEDSEFAEMSEKITEITGGKFGYALMRNNTGTAALSVIASALQSNNFKKEHYKLVGTAEEMFKKFKEEHEEELAEYGISTIKDMGKHMVENLLKYDCYEVEAWKSKYQGLGGSQYSCYEPYSYGEPSLEVVTDGEDTLYFDAYDVSTEFLVRVIANKLGKGKTLSVGVTDYDVWNHKLVSYNPAKEIPYGANMPVRPIKTINVIEEFNEAFGREVCSVENVLPYITPSTPFQLYRPQAPWLRLGCENKGEEHGKVYFKS